MRSHFKIETMRACADAFYSAIHLTPNQSRLQEQVRARSALCKAFEPYAIQEEIATILGKDRTTLCHSLRQHDAWVATWEGYKNKYTIAKEIVDRRMSSIPIKERINGIQNRINFLEEEKQLLETQINLINE
jgi:hypothetical protein